MLLSCPLCMKPHFDGVDALRSTLITAATSQISCPVCNEILMGLDKLTIHLFTHITSVHVEEDKTQPVVNAECCSVAPPPSEEEIVQQDKVVEQLRCDICNFQFGDANILDMHQKLLHQTIEDRSTGVYSYHCHLCSKKFKMRGSLMVHLRVAHYGFGHNNDGIATAGRIDEANDDLANKSGGNNNVKQWSCDVCSKLFTTKYFLKKHKRLHTGEMPYYCAQCNKSFTFQQSYHKHMLYHSSEKPHVCSECGRAFKELSTLHNHERIHSGERPFACETCGKCFRQRVSYLVHRRIHTGVMPYKCTACEKTFRYKVSQRSHKCPINPPGLVVLTTTTTASDTQTLATSTTTSSAAAGTASDFADPSMSTIIFNVQGEIIGQNFTYDGKNVITYDMPKNESDNNNLVQTPPPNPDFFTMVMSPTLPDVESLCLSNSPQHRKDTLQTINEESLKELLYGEATQ